MRAPRGARFDRIVRPVELEALKERLNLTVVASVDKSAYVASKHEQRLYDANLLGESVKLS